LFTTALISERFALAKNASMFTVHDDDLERAEGHLWRSAHAVLPSPLYAPHTGSLIGQSYLNEHGFSMMADDEHRADGHEVPGVMAGAIEVARAAGLWWPFEQLVILSERPAVIHVNERHLLHNGDGVAIEYRDGWRVYAWNGKAVPERWIMDPASVPLKEVRGFDPTFRKHLESRAGGGAAAKKTKPSASTIPPGTTLPTDHAARLAALRERAAGRVPLFERYMAGEHEAVWKDLVALGPTVREDLHVHDALAVTYETMRRVEQNVRALVQRLTASGYRFETAGTGLSGLLGRLTRSTPSVPHVPPKPGAAKDIARFEKKFGTLPLSVRVFYEVVGSVDLRGRHPDIDPPGNTVAPDPLVVDPLDEEGMLSYDEDDGDGEGAPDALMLAPDDLHKAGTSGGAPYEIAIPDLRADGELLNERHHLFFVDYLRLCFRFGGFPGYEGQAEMPGAIARLGEGLVSF
jgi:hypothetical protein